MTFLPREESMNDTLGSCFPDTWLLVDDADPAASLAAHIGNMVDQNMKIQ